MATPTQAPWGTVSLLPFDARLACFYCGAQCTQKGSELHCGNRYCRGVGEIERVKSEQFAGQHYERVQWRRV